MGLYLKIAAGLLLLIQTFHPASFQNATDATDAPRRTIDKAWLRELAKNTAGSQNAVNTEEADSDPGSDADGESTNDYSSGIASGSMAIYSEGEENASGQDNRVRETTNNLTTVATTVPPTFPTNVTTRKAKLPDATVSPTNVTSDPTTSRQINKTKAENEFHNSTMTPQKPTTHPSAQNSTHSSGSNHTDLPTTTLAPESNATQKSTAKPNKDTGLTNATKSTTKTTATTTTIPTTTMKQKKNETSTKSSSTTAIPSETTGTSPTTTTIAAPITPEKANKTDKDAASGSNSERGLATDNHGAWGAVLGTGVAVSLVGLVAFIILKKKHVKGFSHSKLVEDYPSETVHRLDNSAPLDLNFGVGSSAYYNPGLQGDNIQMTNFPGRR
ncbi:uncharacterized protein LOC141759909 [Sebastes fasciatus]|uniref:uncharacterized protein LOC141759909 n=1 Tax=Sebastes fasciatus TaxID=394691 RepID=UPI003D9F39D0